METDQKRTYEGMFLLDAGQDFETAAQPVRAVLERYGAELLSVKPWDERKLVYPVAGRKRGLYVLTYFAIDPSQLDEVENDCGLDERILRALLLRKEDLSEEEIQAETPATASARRTEQERERREEAAAAEEKPEQGEEKPEAATEPAEAEESSATAEPAAEAESPAENEAPAEDETPEPSEPSEPAPKTEEPPAADESVADAEQASDEPEQDR